MEYLDEFEWKISLMEGMLIETGGKFGECGLHDYVKSCLEIAQEYYESTKDRNNLLKIVNSYLSQYETEISWKYYQYEMQFLNTLKTAILKL